MLYNKKNLVKILKIFLSHATKKIILNFKLLEDIIEIALCCATKKTE